MNTKASLAVIIMGLSQALTSFPAYAWNGFGHMTVAYVAYKELTPRTRKRAFELLKLNPYYQKWRSAVAENLSNDEYQAQIFMLAATWPDQIRSDSEYKSDGDADGTRANGPEANLNIGYADHLLHKYWHHYDKPMAIDSTKLPTIPEPNALTQISAFRKVLASDAPDELKSYDLTWLLHLVGDLHQPLHCITRVSKEEPEGDEDALKVMLNPPGPDSSLHWFWDCALGKDGPDKVAAFAETLPSTEGSLANDLRENDWIEEGYRLAKEKVYVSPIEKGNGPFKMTDSYRNDATALAKQRAALAGKRLANLLNNELK